VRISPQVKVLVVVVVIVHYCQPYSYTAWLSRVSALMRYSAVVQFLRLSVSLLAPLSCFGVRGSVVGWGTTLQAGRSRDRIPDEVDFFIYLIPPAALWPWGRLSLLTEMSTRNIPGGEGRPARKADLTAICEPIVYKMWEPQHLTTLWVSTARYRDTFTFFTWAASAILSSPTVTPSKTIICFFVSYTSDEVFGIFWYPQHPRSFFFFSLVFTMAGRHVTEHRENTVEPFLCEQSAMFCVRGSVAVIFAIMDLNTSVICGVFQL
jgi:hypothetical protein